MFWLMPEGAAARVNASPFGPRRLTDAALAAGHRVVTTRWDGAGADLSAVPRGAACALYGAHRFLLFAAGERSDLAPGVFWGPDLCGHPAVSARLGEIMLNAGAESLSAAEALGRLRRGARLFLRPERSDKAFAGAVFRGEDARISGLDPDLRVVAAPVAEIRAEYRFVVVRGRVVTGSQYARGGLTDVRVDFDPDCAALAQRAAGLYAPLTAFVCDVAETPAGPRVVEYNGFGSAGLYACDCRPVVTEIAEALASCAKGGQAPRA